MQNDFFPTEKIADIRNLLSGAKRIVILTHISPDGDAMGSSLGTYHYLKSRKTDAESLHLIVPNRFPSFFNWMPSVDQVLVYEEHTQEADQIIADADLIICTDFNEPKRIGPVGERMMANACPKILVDHHLHPSDFARVTLSYPQSPSASELVYRLVHQLDTDYDTETVDSALQLAFATCIYTGMMTDTGNFSFNSNHPEMYEILADLVRMGVDKDAVYNAVFNAHSADRMRLVGYSLYQKMRIFPEYHAALICLSRKELYRFNFQAGDAEGIVNMPLQISDVYYSCFMREDKIEPHERERAGEAKSKIKISFRSQGDRPVNVFASDFFHGGGHANAAGGEFFGTIDESKQCFMDHFKEYFRRD